MFEHLLEMRIISLNSFSVLIPNISIYLLLAAVLLVVVEAYRFYLIRVRPTIEKIEKNHDGTLEITWGYVNYTTKDIHLMQSQSTLLVNDGAAIIVGASPPHRFSKGRHRRAFQMVVTEQCNVEWIIGNRRKRFLGNYKKGRDLNEKRSNV